MRQPTIYEKQGREKFLAQFGSKKIGITRRDGSLICLNSDLVKVPSWRPNGSIKLPQVLERSSVHKLIPIQKDSLPTRIPRLSARRLDESVNITQNDSIDVIMKNMKILDLIESSDASKESILALERSVNLKPTNHQDLQTRFMETIKKYSKWGPDLVIELTRIVEGLLPFEDISIPADPEYDFDSKKYDIQTNTSDDKCINNQSSALPNDHSNSKNVWNNFKRTTQMSNSTISSSKPNIRALPAIKPANPHPIPKFKPPAPKRKQLSYSEMINQTRPPIIPCSSNTVLNTRPNSVSTSSTRNTYTPVHNEIDTQTDFDLFSENPPHSLERRISSTNSTKSNRQKHTLLPPIVKLGGLGPSMDSEGYLEGLERRRRQKIYAERIRKMVRQEPKPIKPQTKDDQEVGHSKVCGGFTKPIKPPTKDDQEVGHAKREKVCVGLTKMKEYAARVQKPKPAPKPVPKKMILPPLIPTESSSLLAKLQQEYQKDLKAVAEIRNSSLLKYDNPLIISKSDPKEKKTAKAGTKSQPEDILNVLLPPRQWMENGELWIQKVSHTPATRLDVITLQEQLDMTLQKTQARETGIDPIRRDLYSQCFDELIRQVTITCQERGLLLLRVRDEIKMSIAAYQTLYESSIAFGMRKALQAEEGKTEMEQRIKDLEEDKVALEQSVRELKAKIEAAEKREAEQKALEDRKHAEELSSLKKANAQLKTQLEGILAPTKNLAHKQAYQIALKPFVSRQKLSEIQSLVSEYSSYFLFAKLFIIYEQSIPIASLIYKLDMILILLLWGFFLQAVFARHPIYDATKFLRNKSSSNPPSIFTWSFWLRFSNPIWTSRSVLFHEGIIYATNQEIQQASECGGAQILSLDIFQHPSFPRSCPVVIYIHGGAWTSGSKSERPPVISYLALKRYVVVSINYRLTNITDQIVDVKRAIRWVKQNIARFGGDEGFVTLLGCDAGAQLACMAAMTGSLYQPGFEDVDTSVNGVVCVNGFYDLTRSWGYKFGYGLRKVCKDLDTARRLSPTWLLKEVEANKLRVSASDSDKKGIKVPPFLILHAGNDCLAPIRHVYEFKKEFQLATHDSRIIMIELQGAGHEFYKWSNVRSHTISYGIEPFIRSLYEEYLAEKIIDD